MNEVFNLAVSAALTDTLIFRFLLGIAGLAGLIHFGLRTHFIPRTAPYALRLACASTATACGSVMFLSVNSQQLLVLLVGSVAFVVYIVYDLLAWHYGVSVSDCFKCPNNKDNLLESLQNQRGPL
jgi:hypothetical protein